MEILLNLKMTFSINADTIIRAFIVYCSSNSLATMCNFTWIKFTYKQTLHSLIHPTKD